MTRLPSLSSDDIARALRKAGFAHAPKRGKGSHIAMFKQDARGKHLVIIPKRKDVPMGTMLAIFDQAGLLREEFIALL